MASTRVVGDEQAGAGERGEVAAQLGADLAGGSRRRGRRAARRAAAARGSVARARARATRCAWPPDSARGLGVRRGRRARAVEPAAAPRPGPRPSGAPGAQAEGDVVERRELGEQEVVLEHHADRAVAGRDEGAGGWVVEHDAVELDRARRRAARARRGPAARWSCRRRSGPSRATTSPSPTSSSTSRSRSPSADADGGVAARRRSPARPPASGRAAAPAPPATRRRARGRGRWPRRGRTRGRGTRRAAWSGCGPGGCRRR